MDPKNLVKKLTKKWGTNDPFALADDLHVIILRSDLKGVLGYFNRYKRIKFIHLNSNIPGNIETFVCAHELGHALLHSDINTPFLKTYTLFSTDKIEREASRFAVELLLPDNILYANKGQSIYQLAICQGIPENLVRLKEFEVIR